MGTRARVVPFDALATLADLNSPEAQAADGAIIVTGTVADLLGELSEAFVFEN